MHQAIQDGLEEYLAGNVSSQDRSRIEAHLAACAECHAEVEAMREMSNLFQSLRSNDDPVPEPGFYARLSERIELSESSSIWAAFLQPVFGRQIAFASLLLLATLGTLMMINENEYSLAPSPEMVLALERDATLATAARDRDAVRY